MQSFCFRNYLNHRNYSYATEVRSQLEGICHKWKLTTGAADVSDSSDDDEATASAESPVKGSDPEYVNVRKCLLMGFYDNVAQLQKDNTYKTLSSHQRAKIHPSSCLNGKERPEWLFYTEFLSTAQNYLKMNTVVEAKWFLEMPKLFKGVLDK